MLSRAALAPGASFLLAASLCACHGSTSAARARGTAPHADAQAMAYRPLDLPKIDVHTHIDYPESLPVALETLRRYHILHVVNLSGHWPGGGLEQTLAAARAAGHTTVFCNLDLRLARRPGYGKLLVAQLEQAHALGARGLKIYKGLGLGAVGPDGRLLAVDDPELGQVFERAGELGMPVTIHTGDPKAFWQPPTPDNERYDELSVHPHWSYYGEPVPSWEELYAEFGRLVAAHPHTTFIGAHFANDPEEPERVAAMLDKDPNLYADTAARIPEIGRHPADRMHALFLREQNRILFGTDTAFDEDGSVAMVGSGGADPPGPADVDRFFFSSWRYFETWDKQIPSPTPIQGRWNVDGVALPRSVLEKIYYGNAARLLGVPLAELGVAGPASAPVPTAGP